MAENNKFLKKFDKYDIKARIWPALLICLPLTLVVMVWFPQEKIIQGSIWSMFGCFGGSMLLAQLGRDMGKNKESWLFQRWDGQPAVRLLRHRNSANTVRLRVIHKKLENLFSDIRIPSAAREAANPEQADRAYDACIHFLRDRTRDKKAFPLVFEENCNYGFRRNLWGLKPVGILFNVAAITLLVVYAWVNFPVIWNNPIFLLASIINIGFLLVWLLFLRPDWVRVPAEAYAERIVEAIGSLER